MKKGIVYLVSAMLLFLMPSVLADDVEYGIPDYKGELRIHQDNSADFKQQISYQFDTDYNGQIVTLGTDRMPEGFSVDKEPKVSAVIFRNGKKRSAKVHWELTKEEAGYKLKIYNKGYEDDKVTVTVSWHLKNMLYAYQDIAELRWLPITNWDVSLENVRFSVSTDKAVKDSKLWGHLGAFTPSLQASLTDKTYTLTRKNVDGKLELHGYWDRSYLTSVAHPIASKRKAIILKQEKLLVKQYQEKLTRFGKEIPVIILVAGAVGLIFLVVFVWRINRFARFEKHDRLYEVPEDLSPLLVANSVYATTLEDAQNGNSSDISFTNLAQATILDLIDRKVLSYDGHELSFDKLERATDYELDFLKLAFGDAEVKTVKTLFSDYAYDYDKTLARLEKRYSGSQLEDEMKKSSRSISRLLNERTAAVDRDVDSELAAKGIDSPYRDLTNRETLASYLIYIWAFSFGLVSLCLFAYILMTLPQLWPAYAYLVVLALGYAGLVYHLMKPLQTKGVVTKEGAYRLYQWHSFKQMLLAVKTFERAELESIVVWNRILVYATLFGYADKVEKALRVHGMRLPDSFATVTFSDFNYAFALSASHYTASVTGVASASSFSLPASSGTGVSGGFTGGGGGGGGGAF